MEQWSVSIRIQVSNKNIEETTLLEKNFFGKIKLPRYGVYSKFANIANIKEDSNIINEEKINGENKIA